MPGSLVAFATTFTNVQGFVNAVNAVGANNATYATFQARVAGEFAVLSLEDYEYDGAGGIGAITGIQVDLYYQHSIEEVAQMYVVASLFSGFQLGFGKEFVSESPGVGFVSFGGPGDLWGWTEPNLGFGVRMTLESPTDSSVVNLFGIDAVKITIYYDDPVTYRPSSVNICIVAGIIQCVKT